MHSRLTARVRHAMLIAQVKTLVGTPAATLREADVSESFGILAFGVASTCERTFAQGWLRAEDYVCSATAVQCGKIESLSLDSSRRGLATPRGCGSAR